LLMQLTDIEKGKIACAHKFFEAINRRHAKENVKYEVVTDFAQLTEIACQ